MSELSVPAGDSSPQVDAAEGDVDEFGMPALVSLRSIQSLRQLRDRIRMAALELMRLRKQNDALEARVNQLESDPRRGLEGTVLAFEESPEHLRETVEGFIETIDAYLAKDSE